MSVRRFAVPAVALAVLACQPSIPNQSPPQTVAFAVSFPDSSDGTQSFQPPLPNDLVLQATTATPPPAVPAAQLALLNAFRAAGGFPNDQEVPIQIQFFAVKPDAAGGTPTPTAFPDIDTTTVTASTLAVLRVDSGTPTPVEFEVAPTDYDATTGVLTVHKKVDPATGARWWATGPGGGRYVVALRGGDKGVKTKSGQVIASQVSTLLISQDKDLTKFENQGLLNTQPDPAAAGARLEQIRLLYANPVKWVNTAGGWVPGPPAAGAISALAAVDAVFPHQEIASVQTFVVDPDTSARVATDASAGIAPLPSEFLMNSDPTKGTSYYAAAPGGGPFAGAKVSVPASGALASLAAGLDRLDGFTTTGLLLVPTIGTPVAAASVTGSSVVLLEKASAGVPWAPVLDFTSTQPTGKYLTLPPPITIDTATGKACTQPYGPTCVAEVIGLQPAVGVPLPDGSIVPLPPLDEHAEYAVIVTSDVKDVDGNSIRPGTLGKIVNLALPTALGGQNLVLFEGGKSQLSGVSDADAQRLQFIANELTTDVIPGAAGAGVDPTKIVTAFTFVTQSITGTAQLLVGAVTTAPAPVATLVAAQTLTLDAAAKKYGITPGAFVNPSPPNNPIVDHFVDATLVTLDLLDPATGAFHSDPAAAAPSQIPVLIAVPLAPTVPAGGAPVVVFRHGLNGGRAQMLGIAGALASQGMVVAAIDAAKFGDRAWCTTDADCATGSTCDHTKFGNQGDPAGATPGLCTAGLAENPVQSSCTQASGCWDGSGGVAKSSGAFFVSANLFRLRDSMRQDIIDEAALAKAMANAGGALGVTIDAGNIFYVGQSLGSINGAVDVSVNPTFKKAVFNVGGGTFVDIASDSPAFQSLLAQLTTSLGIEPGTSAFLQFLQVGKWVIDPADPINFLGLSFTGKNSPPTLGQAARCDNVVPNKENQLFYALLGKSPTNPTGSQANSTMQWYMQDATTACPTDGTTGQGATHGFLLDLVNPSLTAKAQTNAAAFLVAGAGATTPVLP